MWVRLLQRDEVVPAWLVDRVRLRPNLAVNCVLTVIRGYIKKDTVELHVQLVLREHAVCVSYVSPVPKGYGATVLGLRSACPALPGPTRTSVDKLDARTVKLAIIPLGPPLARCSAHSVLSEHIIPNQVLPSASNVTQLQKAIPNGQAVSVQVDFMVLFRTILVTLLKTIFMTQSITLSSILLAPNAVLR